METTGIIKKIRSDGDKMDMIIDCDKCPIGRRSCIYLSQGLGISTPLSSNCPGGVCLLYNTIQAIHKANNLDSYNVLVNEHNTLMKDYAKLKKDFDVINEDYKKYQPMLFQMSRARKDLKKESEKED